MKIKKGDNVIVISGKDKGKTGKVEKTLPGQNLVVVEGINIATKHQKNRRARSQGQVIEMNTPIDASNVALIEDGKPVRVGYKMEGEGDKAKKVRISKKTGKTL